MRFFSMLCVYFPRFTRQGKHDTLFKKFQMHIKPMWRTNASDKKNET